MLKCPSPSTRKSWRRPCWSCMRNTRGIYRLRLVVSLRRDVVFAAGLWRPVAERLDKRRYRPRRGRGQCDEREETNGCAKHLSFFVRQNEVTGCGTCSGDAVRKRVITRMQRGSGGGGVTERLHVYVHVVEYNKFFSEPNKRSMTKESPAHFLTREPFFGQRTRFSRFIYKDPLTFF